MLIRFFIENFLSFNEQSEFSMIKGRARKYSNHVIKSNNQLSVLKSAVLYGANASGKTNFVRALDFVKNFVVKGKQPEEPILIEKFKFDKKSLERPSCFQIEIYLENQFYLYGFQVDYERVVEEWLYEIKGKKEVLLFSRKAQKNEESKLSLGDSLKLSKRDKQFIEFVGKGTPSNQLFLTESNHRNVKYFTKPYEWFRDVLQIIFPYSKYDGIEFFFEEQSKIKDLILKIIKYFDVGISDIILEKFKVEQDFKDIPEEVISVLKKGLKRNDMKMILSSPRKDRYMILSSPRKDRYIVSKDKNEDLIAQRLISKHKMKESDEYATLKLGEESEGTQRIMDLLPILISFLPVGNVFVIDEIERSLHPLLVKRFINLFLSPRFGGNLKQQLITTTHESNLLDLELLRRDEIWFVEKNQYQESCLYSLEEFKPRYDKDIQKGYLNGRFGAIPFIREPKDLGW